MIRVTVEIREGGFSRRVQITAPYIERALKIAGDGVPGRRVRLVFPMILHFKGDEAAREHPGE